MQFVLLSTGSLGDVQPFVALGVGLQRAGQAVRLAGPADSRGLCERFGLEFYPIDEEHQARLGQAGEPKLEGGNTLRFGLARAAGKRRIYRAVNRAAWAACQGAEAIVYRIGGFLAGDSIAERLGVACFKAGLVPYTATRDFPSLYVYRGRDLGRLGNWLSHGLSEQALWQFLRGEANGFREEIGLRRHPLGGPGWGAFTRKLPVLYAFSPTLLARPADWPELAQITGQWALEEGEDWQPPAGLAEFLEGGEAVSIGFGSMAGQEAEATERMAVEALRLSGLRGVVSGFWGAEDGGGAVSETVYRIGRIPHSWLFRRVRLVVQHGGVGTTTAALRAGKPMVVAPFNYDQPFWAAQVERLGVGAATSGRQRLGAAELAGAMRRCLEDEGMAARAAAAGERVRAEEGVGTAVLMIRQIMQGKLKMKF